MQNQQWENINLCHKNHYLGAKKVLNMKSECTMTKTLLNPVDTIIQIDNKFDNEKLKYKQFCMKLFDNLSISKTKIIFEIDNITFIRCYSDK